MKYLLSVFALVFANSFALAGDTTLVIQPGGAVTMTGSAEGTEPITFTWYRNGVEIHTGTTFAITNMAMENGGTYTLIATNAGGSTLSNDRVILLLGGGDGIPPTPNVASGDGVATGTTGVTGALALP